MRFCDNLLVRELGDPPAPARKSIVIGENMDASAMQQKAMIEEASVWVKPELTVLEVGDTASGATRNDDGYILS
jgi:hypothetical protein